MKQPIATWLIGFTILMSGCRKDDPATLQKLTSNALANVNANTTTDSDEVTGSKNDVVVGNHDYNWGGPGIYNSIVDGQVHQVDYYYGKLEIIGRYRTRNLQVMVTIPYQYDYSRSNGRIYKIGPAEQGDGNPVVSFIGTPGDIVDTYSYGSVGVVQATSHLQTLQTNGNAIYGASEKRTIVTSVNGGMKVIAGFNAEVIEIGSEIEAGFTVQSAKNETGVHSGEVSYTLKVAVSGWTSQYPNFQRTASLNGAFYGTVKD
ncbi:MULTISPECIES: hypothetical protein [unclassified Chitinophaga]|uniref:hypothetical protein n=1 Tax=unclassified Chitinophaga TaxID=2619133 RepID=UPI0030105F91